MKSGVIYSSKVDRYVGLAWAVAVGVAANVGESLIVRAALIALITGLIVLPLVVMRVFRPSQQDPG